MSLSTHVKITTLKPTARTVLRKTAATTHQQTNRRMALTTQDLIVIIQLLERVSARDVEQQLFDMVAKIKMEITQRQNGHYR